MAHSLTTASHSSACAELGISVGTNRTQTSLTRHATINKWSFYRPGSIAPNVSDYVTLTAPSSNDKLGDFRGYNHSAGTPATPSDFNKNWGPGGTTISIAFTITINELNIKELYGAATPYYSIRYYLTSANRDSQVSYIRTYTTAVPLTSNSPPTGHTNNQTQRPSSSTQIITDSSFPTSAITKPNDILYCDIYFSDVSGNQLVRFGAALADGHVNVSTHEYANPFIDACSANISGSPFTVAYVVVTNSSSNKNGVDISATQGSTSYPTHYWYIVGLSGSTWYRIGSISVTAYLRIRNPEGGTLQNTTTIHSGALNFAGASSNQYEASGTLASGYSWAYDDVGDVEVTVPSWSGYSSYNLGTIAPTCT